MKRTKKNSISRIAISFLAMLLLAVAPSIVLADPVQDAANPQIARRVRRELVTLP